ncbi:MAG TPA: hypothetical protein VNK96_05715 [Fimbriimonadales bacterium]|nr:hypothetical protein [Fimbriimonadales bacterium]
MHEEKFETREPIGHVVGTEKNPTTAYSFRFWAYKDFPIGIGTLVKVVYRNGENEAKVYGTVIEAHAYDDSPNAFADYQSRKGKAAFEAPSNRLEMREYEAAVLRRDPPDPIGAVGLGEVYEAEKEDLQTALGADKFVEEGIPVGVYGKREKPIPVLIDPAFLLGPEAGHLNVTGTSGLAAKTSFILFLLQSLLQKYNEHTEIAAVLFNTKGGDLLYLDCPQKDDLPEEDRKIYEACEIEPKPFEKVVFYAPFADEARVNLRTLRNHEELVKKNPTHGFCYGVDKVLEHADVLLDEQDMNTNADAFLHFLRRDVLQADGFVIKEDMKDDLKNTISELPSGERSEIEALLDNVENPKRIKARNLLELMKIVYILKKTAASKGKSEFLGHHIATWDKMYRKLNGFALRFRGLISETGDSNPPLPEKFENRSVYVIDISRMDGDAQELIFAEVITRLKEKMEKKELGVERLIIAVDELNEFAPSGGRMTEVMRTLRDISARGRYMGLVLFGAQQFRSRVDAQVVGNCSNSAYGHIEMEELSSDIYRVYSPAIREKLATASPGEMMIRHPHFSQPVFVRFPRPCVLKGEDGMVMYPAVRELDLEESLITLAVQKSNGKVSPKAVRDEIACWDSLERDRSIKKAIRELDILPNGKDETSVMNVIRKCGKKVPRRREHQFPDEPDDPFLS